MADVPVVVFSDFTCPFSHVTEAALRRIASEGGVAPRYQPFELHPAPGALPAAIDPAQLEAATALAAEAGVALAPPGFVPRTRKAHEAARIAAEHGVEAALRAAIFNAYFGEGRDIGRIDVLVELAAGVGLDPGAVKVVLDLDTHAAEVAAAAGQARSLGMSAIPALVVGSGAAAAVLVGARGLAELRQVVQEMQTRAASGAGA